MKHIKHNFYSVAWFMPQGWNLGVLGIKNWSLGICDGAPSTVCSSLDLYQLSYHIDCLLLERVGYIHMAKNQTINTFCMLLSFLCFKFMPVFNTNMLSPA